MVVVLGQVRNAARPSNPLIAWVSTAPDNVPSKSPESVAFTAFEFINGPLLDNPRTAWHAPPVTTR
ncbi:MAG: hypothetical protein WCB57_05225 [Pseudonocardiaceae bacterium]